MDGVAARPMTVAEFLAWEARQDLRSAFDGVRPLALPEIGVTLLLGALYEGVIFPGAEAGPQ